MPHRRRTSSERLAVGDGRGAADGGSASQVDAAPPSADGPGGERLRLAPIVGAVVFVVASVVAARAAVRLTDIVGLVLFAAAAAWLLWPVQTRLRRRIGTGGATTVLVFGALAVALAAGALVAFATSAVRRTRWSSGSERLRRPRAARAGPTPVPVVRSGSARVFELGVVAARLGRGRRGGEPGDRPACGRPDRRDRADRLLPRGWADGDHRPGRPVAEVGARAGRTLPRDIDHRGRPPERIGDDGRVRGPSWRSWCGRSAAPRPSRSACGPASGSSVPTVGWIVVGVPVVSVALEAAPLQVVALTALVITLALGTRSLRSRRVASLRPGAAVVTVCLATGVAASGGALALLLVACGVVATTVADVALVCVPIPMPSRYD